MTATPELTATISAPRSASSRAARLPGLDGLRGISVVMVVLWHIALNGLAHNGLFDRLWMVDPGNLGVRVFFVLSGFLITTLLLEERAAAGRIDLLRFYFRRTMRIMPAYYVFLACMAVASAYGLVRVPDGGLLRAATYVSNYASVGWALGHTWSLSVEEQFYLLWPGALVLLGLRRGFVAAALMLAVAPVFRVLATHTPPLWPTYWRFAFECVADALATGCLLAYLRPAMWRSARYRAFLSSRAVVLRPVALVVVSVVNVRHQPFAAAIGVTLLNLMIALVVDWALRFPHGLVGRLLNWRPVAFVGTMSYSLYLWQEPFLPRRGGPPLPLALVLIAVIALISYLAVERPILRVRSRLERRLFRSTRSIASAHAAP